MSSSLLLSLIRRSGVAPMPTPIASETIKALVLLSAPSTLEPASQSIASIARKDSAAVSDAVAKIKLDVSKPEHGTRLAILTHGLARVRSTDEVVWQSLDETLTRGLTAGAWTPRDIRTALRATARWGTYKKDLLPQAAERYAASKAPYADGVDLAAIAAGLTALTECSNSSALHTIAQRLVLIRDTVSPGVVGTIARCFVQARFKEPTMLQSVVLDQLDRLTPLLEGSNATAVLAFWALHKYDGVVNALDVPAENSGTARRMAAAAQTQNETIKKRHDQLSALLRRAVAELTDDCASIVALLRCLTALSHDQWLNVAAAADEALDAAGVLSQELLASDTPPSVENLTALMPRYFQAVRDRPARLMPSENATSSLVAFALHAEGRAEELVAHESSPYFIVTCLLGTSVPECRKAATTILQECRLQESALPTLQTFRYILSYGDHGDFEPTVLCYLRKSFLLTLEGIPLVQLCTALRCFAAAELKFVSTNAEIPAEDEELADEFLGDAAIILTRRGFGYDLRLLLSMLHSFSIIAAKATPAADAIRQHLQGALDTLCAANPDPTMHPKVYGAAASSFLIAGSVTDLPPHVKTFLEGVATKGRDDDPLAKKPSAWMKENDPSNTILPRTPSELKLDSLVKDMAATRGDNPEQMAKLGNAFVKMLKDVHPDNVRFIFELFASKVIKEDKVLRDAVVHLTQTCSVSGLSGFSIASILDSAAKIRFSYFKPLKEMLEQVLDEQWAMLDPMELEMVVSALAKLNIRTPSILLALSERAVGLAPTLTERNVCGIVASFQTLGIHDDALFSALLQRAAAVANALSPSAVALLLSGPMAYRLPLNEATAGPLVDRLCRVSDDLSPYQRGRISATLKKTTLPAAMLSGATARLLIE